MKDKILPGDSHKFKFNATNCGSFSAPPVPTNAHVKSA